MKKHLQFAEACRKGDMTLIRALIKDKVNINAKDSKGFAPIHWASNWMRYEVIEILLKNGANANLLNREGYSPIDLLFQNPESMEAYNALNKAFFGNEPSGASRGITSNKNISGKFRDNLQEYSLEMITKIFHLLHQHQARDFDVEMVFSTCEKYGIAGITDFLATEGYDINKIRDENEKKRAAEMKLHKKLVKLWKELLEKNGYCLEQVASGNSIKSFRYIVRDKKSSQALLGHKGPMSGLTLEQIAKIVEIKMK